MTPEQYTAAWTRRPSSAVARLGARQLLLLSARDLLWAARTDGALLVALIAPAPAALIGFARAARDSNAPLVVVRPNGSLGEKGPEESRDDSSFVEAAFKAAQEIGFTGPMALLKDPPAPGGAELERVLAEVDAGYTGMAVRLGPGEIGKAAVDAGKAVAALELGLEVVPTEAAGPEDAAAMVTALRSRGARPSAVRLTGYESRSREFGEPLSSTAVSSAADGYPELLAPLGVTQVVAGAPFLRALRRSAPAPVWEMLLRHCKEKGASLEQAAAHHQRLLRDLPPAAHEKLEALACFEAAELFAKVGAVGSNPRYVERIGQMQLQS